jgi:transposase
MGKPVSEDVQWIIIRLSTAMSRENIAMYTGISHRKIDSILSTFNKHGTVKSTTRQKRHTYASLCDDDIEVLPIYLLCTTSISNATQHLRRTMESTPDLYLDELRQDLELHNGKSVSTSTIWRTLRKAGYTMKKVRRDTYCHMMTQHIDSSHVLPWNGMLMLAQRLLLGLVIIGLIN